MVNGALDNAYLVLDHWSQRVADTFGPAGVAQVDRQAAAGRDALATYGIDLADDTARDATVAVLEIVVASLASAGTHRTAILLAFLQQACQRANAMSATGGGT